jgi:hypothetical protein
LSRAIFGTSSAILRASGDAIDIENLIDVPDDLLEQRVDIDRLAQSFETSSSVANFCWLLSCARAAAVLGAVLIQVARP